MADRNFNPAQALEKEIKTLFAEIAIGATGAPTLTKGLGIASIARTAAGKYTLTLEDKYVRFMGASIIQEDSTEQDLTFQLDAVAVGPTGTTVPTVKFIAKTAATATDPAEGSNLYITLHLKNSVSGE